MEKIFAPELGEGIEKATVACWHKAVGDRVSANDDIVELVTDKAAFNVCAGIDGVIKKIFINEGQEARIGDVLALVEP